MQLSSLLSSLRAPFLRRKSGFRVDVDQMVASMLTPSKDPQTSLFREIAQDIHDEVERRKGFTFTVDHYTERVRDELITASIVELHKAGVFRSFGPRFNEKVFRPFLELRSNDNDDDYEEGVARVVAEGYAWFFDTVPDFFERVVPDVMQRLVDRSCPPEELVEELRRAADQTDLSGPDVDG